MNVLVLSHHIRLYISFGIFGILEFQKFRFFGFLDFQSIFRFRIFGARPPPPGKAESSCALKDVALSGPKGIKNTIVQ